MTSLSLVQEMSDRNFKNVFTSSIRIMGCARSRIDHLWVNKTLAAKASVGYDWFSDHSPLLCSFSRDDNARQPVLTQAHLERHPTELQVHPGVSREQTQGPIFPETHV